MQTKLKLNLEDLTVDSFDTSRPAQKEGTVFGEQCTCYTQCTCPGCPTCANYYTCDRTCGGTCGENTCAASCNGTCDQATCEYSCAGGCDYSLYCDTNQPCPTNAYSNCAGSPCW
jgi:hypothetical protein